MARRGDRRVQPSMVFVIVVFAAAAWWAFASRDDHDYSRPPPPTFTDSQLASLDDEERALVLWLADTMPEWEGLELAVSDFDRSAAQRDLRNLERSCRQITDAAERLTGRLPAPQPEVDRQLHVALAAYVAGGDACRAVARGDVEQIEAMDAAFDEGDQAFATAAERFPDLSCADGSVPPGTEPC